MANHENIEIQENFENSGNPWNFRKEIVENIKRHEQSHFLKRIDNHEIHEQMLKTHAKIIKTFHYFSWKFTKISKIHKGSWQFMKQPWKSWKTRKVMKNNDAPGKTGFWAFWKQEPLETARDKSQAAGEGQGDVLVYTRNPKQQIIKNGPFTRNEHTEKMNLKKPVNHTNLLRRFWWALYNFEYPLESSIHTLPEFWLMWKSF